MSDIKCDILKEYGTLSYNDHSGYEKIVAKTSWNNREPKIEIRDWNQDRTRCRKGVGLTDEELYNLKNLLDEMFEGGEF